MYEGSVKNIVASRGFGFISHDGGELFFHTKDTIDLPWDETLVERVVRFDITQSTKGPRAVNVRAI